MKGIDLMKIEKITENKIRIIVNLDDLAEKNIDLHSFLSNSIESQSLYLDMLEEAEKTVGFSTKDSKISIEALASSDGLFIFTITKVVPNCEKDVPKKRSVKIKRRTSKIDFEKAIYQFDTFEEFCTFCSYIKDSQLKNVNHLAKNFALYLYNNTYFLIITNINANYPNLKYFYVSISEFAKFINHSENCERKLLEYGKPIMKQNAINRCIKYFINN